MMNKVLPPLPVLNRLGMAPEHIRGVQPVARRSRCLAIVNWLTKYRPPAESSRLEVVKGFVQAFYHLCELEIARRMGQVQGEMVALVNVANVRDELGEGAAAVEGYWQALAIARQLGDQAGVALISSNLDETLAKMDGDGEGEVGAE